MTGIDTRVARIAEATLADQQFVTPIDVLIGLGWLAQPNVDRWLRGLVTSLDRCVGVDDAKTAAALNSLRDWAKDHRPRRGKPTTANSGSRPAATQPPNTPSAPVGPPLTTPRPSCRPNVRVASP